MEYKSFRSGLSFSDMVETCGSAKVLVVDDKERNIQMVGTLFSEYDWVRLSACLSGQKALEVALDYRPDLILLDLNMPDMDGLETLKKLKDMGVLEFSTVVFLTADQQRANRLEGLSIGCADYIHKPFDRDEFLFKVKYHLKMRFFEKVLLKYLGDTRALLNNINQAIFCIDENGLIKPPVSGHSRVIFGEDPTGKHLEDVVLKRTPLGQEDIKRIKQNLLMSYDDSKIGWIAKSSEFPKKITYQGPENEEKVLNIIYTPLWNGEELTSIMLTFEDITEKERFGKTKKQYNLQQIAQKTGLKIETLRSWTKRYSLKGEFKDSKGEYRYSGADLDRFAVFRFLIEKGEKIGQLVRCSDLELKEKESALKESNISNIQNSNDLEKRDVLKSLLYFIEIRNLELFTRDFSKIGALFDKRELTLSIIAPLLDFMNEKDVWKKLERMEANYLKHFISKMINEFSLINPKDQDNPVKGPVVMEVFPSYNSVGGPLASLLAKHYNIETSSIKDSLLKEEVIEVINKIDPPFILLILERKGAHDEREFKKLKEDIHSSISLKKQKFVVLNNHDTIETKNILDPDFEFNDSFEDLEKTYKDYIKSFLKLKRSA
ncbi:MAG: response regulator [Bdellovibrionota bacterium]|nr:response regulator [Bdellovibrionota bacterium]